MCRRISASSPREGLFFLLSVASRFRISATHCNVFISSSVHSRLERWRLRIPRSNQEWKKASHKCLSSSRCLRFHEDSNLRSTPSIVLDQSNISRHTSATCNLCYPPQDKRSNLPALDIEIRRFPRCLVGSSHYFVLISNAIRDDGRRHSDNYACVSGSKYR